MAKYLVETDGGKYLVETEDAPAGQQSAQNAATPQQDATAAPVQTGGGPDIVATISRSASGAPQQQQTADVSTGIRGWPAGMPLPGAAAPPLPEKLRPGAGPAPTIYGTLTTPPVTGEQALSALPYIGAGAMGVATGGLGFLPAVAGAYVGGTAGGGLEQLGRQITGLNPPGSFPEAVNRASAAGAEQAAYETAGYPVGKAIGGLITRMAPENLITKGLMAAAPDLEAPEAGNLAQTVLNEKIPIDRSAPGVVSERLNGVKQQIGDLIGKNPQTIAPDQYVPQIQQQMDAVRARVASSAATNKQQILKAIDDAESGFLRSNANPQPMPPEFGQAGAQAPETVADLRRQAARAINAADMQAMISAEPVDQAAAWRKVAGPQVAAQIDQAINSGLGNSLNAAYPGIAALNARAAQLSGLQNAIAGVGQQGATSYLKALVKGATPGGLGLLTHIVPHQAGIAVGSTLALANMARMAAEDPAITSRAALAIDAARKAVPIPDIPGAGLIKGVLTVPNAVRAGALLLNQSSPQASPTVNRPPAGFTEVPAPPAGNKPATGLPPGFTEVPAPGGLLAPPAGFTEVPAPGNRTAPGRQPPQAMTAPTGWTGEWGQMLTDAARRMGGLPFFSNLLHVLGENEGSGNFRSPATVRSPAGAIGLMQVMPATGRQYGGYSPRDLENPQKNIDAAAQLANHLWTKYGGRPDLAMAAYNAGEGAVDRARGNIARLPLETQRYVQRGMQRWRRMGLPGG